jgi:hypothetical protein
MRSKSLIPVRLPLIAFSCALMFAAMGGCYRHVVSASGPGTETTQVYKPNVPAQQDQPASSKNVPSKTVPTKQAEGK